MVDCQNWAADSRQSCITVGRIGCVYAEGMKRHVGVILVSVLALTGCSWFGTAPSPTSTYTDARGESVTVDWVDYPAYAGYDGEALLGSVDQTDIEPAARELIRDVQAAITGASGRQMTSVQSEGDWFSDENWFVHDDNGYGGESLLVTVNCCELSTASVPDPEQWQSVLDAASDVTVAAGLGPLALHQYGQEPGSDAADSKEYRDRFCTLADGGCWFWSAKAFDGVQWVDVFIEDATLDPTGEAATWAEYDDGQHARIWVSYGATVVRSGQADEYARAIQPFLGLETPESTTSD